MYFANELKR